MPTLLYRTYRGNVGNVAQAQRALTYNLPTHGATSVDLRLHFAERASANNTPGKRVFDIEVEGQVVRDNFDIIVASGATNTAIVLPLDNVAVKDGMLNLVLRPSVDYASIAAIEVLCRGDCPSPDTTAPTTPTGPTANVATGSVALDWANNTETDVVGYNVYRATSSSGPWTKLNAEPVVNSAYTDTGAPAGVTLSYRVTALDSSGNESTSATTKVANPSPGAIRFNAGGPAQTVGGVTWAGCASTSTCSGYVSGGGFPYTQQPLPSITGVVAPANQTLYQTEWTGGQVGGKPVAVGAVAFSFNVPVANGGYMVRLHFTELNKNGTGLRVFDVNLEGGTKELVNFDIFKETGGMHRALVREFPVTVGDGKLTIDFIRQVENAKISAIEIIPVGTAKSTTSRTAKPTARR